MLRTITLFTLLLLTLSLAACGGDTEKTVQISESEAGRRIVLNEGDTLEVTLPGTPGTGYTWEVAPEGITCLRQEGEPDFESESSLVGAPADVTLRFTAVETGEETLRLLYHRPWEEDVAPEETFEAIIVVE